MTRSDFNCQVAKNLRRSTTCLSILGVLALVSAGCMASPNDGKRVADRNEIIRLEGWHIEPGIRVTVQAKVANSDDDTWQQIASGTSSTSALSFTDGNLYSWSAGQYRVPGWAWDRGRAGYHAYLRAQDAADRPLYSTYDDYITCFGDNGQSLVAWAQHCASPNSPVAHVITADYLPRARADTTCAYGTYGCNRCVPDVADAFTNGASGSKDYRHRFYFYPTWSLNGDHPDKLAIQDHLQGITRIPGLGDENWVAITRNARDKGDGAVYLAWFNTIVSGGDAWKWAFQRPENPIADRFDYYRFAGVNHAGGPQALGTMLFVATDCDEGNLCDAYVQVMDVRDPGDALYLNKLVLDGSHGELSAGGRTFSSRAAAVGAVRLDDGRYLVVVRGREQDQNIWFFRSIGQGINASTRWELLDAWHASERPSGDEWHAWENINLIAECGTGDIYMIGMGTKDNKSFLYRVLQSGGPNQHEFSLKEVYGRGLNTSGLLVSLRYAGGVHIAPNGKLVSYVTSRQLGELNEFRYHGNDHGH